MENYYSKSLFQVPLFSHVDMVTNKDYPGIHRLVPYPITRGKEGSDFGLESPYSHFHNSYFSQLPVMSDIKIEIMDFLVFLFHS